MGADCLGTQYAVTKNKSAIAESTKYDGYGTASKEYEGGGVTPEGETNQSGIYTKKNASPGFEA